MLVDVRPWGKYEILLDADDCKVKRIWVNPGARPSYQYHYKRSETWTIISGTGIVTLDGQEIEVVPGSTVEVPVGIKHRIKNTGASEELVFIEVQHGTYFGEDDIVRVEDDYKRNQ